MNKKSLFLLASSMFLLASCGGGGNQDVEETLVTGVKLSSYSIELKEGDAAKAIAYRVDGRGDYNKEVTVASENASVCTVALVENQNQFTVTPVAFGETKINVVSKGDSSKAASLSVKVEKTQDRPEQPHVTGISVSPENERILIGEEVTFTVSLTGVGDFDRTYSVNNEHPDVVTVLESNGDNFKVKALAEGTALIDVISNENSAIAKQVQILVDSPYIPPEVDKVELTYIKKDVELGETFDLAVTSATGDVSWSLDPLDTTIISLSNESNAGVTVTTNAIGSAKVVASVGSAIAECVITVPESKLYGGYAIKLNDGEELSLNKVSKTPEGMLAQYTYSLTNVSAGTVISFFGVTAGVSTCINETVGANGDDPERLIQNNLKESALGDFVVLKDIESEAKVLYFEVYDDRCGFWLDGGPELEINTPMLVGLDGQFDTGIKLSLDTSSDFEKQYYVKNVHIETSQEFKFRFNNYPVKEVNTWAGYEAVEEGCIGLLNDGGEPNHNISVKKDGYYDFYWKLVAGTIWVNKVEEPAPEYNGFMGEVDGVPFDLNPVSPTPKGMKAQYTSSVTAIAGSKIDFYGILDGGNELIDSKIGPNQDDTGKKIQNNLKPATAGGVDFKVLKDCTDATLYFEVYESGFGFWLEGGPEMEEPVPVLLGLGEDWTIGQKMLVNTETPNEYYLHNVEISEADTFKFKFAGAGAEGADLWAGYEEVKEGCLSLVTDCGAPDHNIAIKKAGNYDLYWNLSEGIWIAEHKEPTPEFISYAAKIGGVDYPLTVVEPTPEKENLEAQYKLELDAVAGTRVDFYGVYDGGSMLISSDIGPNQDDTGNKIQNNLKPATSGEKDFTILKDAEDATLYLEVYADWIGFWLTDGPDMLSGFYLKVNGQPAHQLVDDGEIEGGYHQYKALAVALAEGDKVELFDADHDASWMCELQKDAGEYAKFNEEEGYLEANTAGTYDFYVKMKSGEDLLYIGKTPSTDPSITFKASSYNVVVGNEVTVEVETENCGDAEVEFSIEKGGEYAEVKTYSDNSAVVIGYDKGDATITASVSVEGEIYYTEATIHVLEENVKSVYFHNPYTNFTDFSLYLFKGESHNAEWPGEVLSGTTYNDKTYGDCYKVDIDLNTYDTLILAAKEEGKTKQTRDIALSELGEKNLVMFDTNPEAWKEVEKDNFKNDGLITTFSAGSVDPETDTYSVVISNKSKDPVTKELTYKEDTKEYYLDNIELSIYDVLEFYKGDEKLDISPKEDAVDSANNVTINLGTTDIGIIRHVDATKGKGIFLDPEAGTVWVDGNHVSYSIIAGYDGETDLTYKGEGEGYVEYTFKFDEIEDGETIVFFKNGLAINVVLDTHEGNNAKAAKFSDLFDCCDVIKGGKNLSVYLKVYTDPAKYEVWVGEAKGEEPEEITLSLSSPTQDWGFGSGSKMFVWAWGGTSTGAWYEIYFQPGAPGVGYVDLPADTEAFLVVRTNLSTVTPNWEQDQNTEDVAGKIYNKTDNVTIVDGTTSYTVSFYDYYKA